MGRPPTAAVTMGREVERIIGRKQGSRRETSSNGRGEAEYNSWTKDVSRA